MIVASATCFDRMAWFRVYWPRQLCSCWRHHAIWIPPRERCAENEHSIPARVAVCASQVTSELRTVLGWQPVFIPGKSENKRFQCHVKDTNQRQLACQATSICCAAPTQGVVAAWENVFGKVDASSTSICWSPANLSRPESRERFNVSLRRERASSRVIGCQTHWLWSHLPSVPNPRKIPGKCKRLVDDSESGPKHALVSTVQSLSICRARGSQQTKLMRTKRSLHGWKVKYLVICVACRRRTVGAGGRAVWSLVVECSVSESSPPHVSYNAPKLGHT